MTLSSNQETTHLILLFNMQEKSLLFFFWVVCELNVWYMLVYFSWIYTHIYLKRETNFSDHLFNWCCLIQSSTIVFINFSENQLGFYTLQVRYEEIISDSAYLDRILAEGATKASDIADTTLNNVYQAMGFLHRWVEV